LTEEGVRLLHEMSKYNMVLDTSHMAEEAFFRPLSGIRAASLPATPIRACSVKTSTGICPIR
jgi:hypothetical protein